MSWLGPDQRPWCRLKMLPGWGSWVLKVMLESSSSRRLQCSYAEEAQPLLAAMGKFCWILEAEMPSRTAQQGLVLCPCPCSQHICSVLLDWDALIAAPGASQARCTLLWHSPHTAIALAPRKAEFLSSWGEGCHAGAGCTPGLTHSRTLTTQSAF